MTRSYDIAHITDCHDTNPEGGFLAGAKVEFTYSNLADRFNLATRLIRVLPAEEFNTIDVGAKFSELATAKTLDPARLIVAINAAPPSIPNGGKTGNDRKNFVLGKLKNGLVFGGTWGGHCLSYVKPQISELYELVDSNDYGTQFRSLEVLPQALVEYAQGVIADKRIKPIEQFQREIPNAPDHSHAFTIDNFGNVKLVVSDRDTQRLRDTFERNPNASIRFAFGDKSLEFGLAAPETQPRYRLARLANQMFRTEPGTNILSLTSSARRWDAEGNFVDVPQVATLRNQPHQPVKFRLPHIGAPLLLRVA